MTALARTLPSLAPDAQARPRDHAATDRQLSLRPDRDRCSLVTPDGEVLFTGEGPGARRQCLHFAHGLGVLTLMR
jgi:hypothetical protein